MTTPTRTQAEHALASLVHCIRPDWQTAGILAQLRAHPTAPLAQIAAAAIYATTRRDQHTPHLIGEDDGNALDRLTGKIDGPPTPSPPARDVCHYHRTPKPCAECDAYRPTTDPAARIAAARQAIRQTGDQA